MRAMKFIVCVIFGLLFQALAPAIIAQSKMTVCGFSQVREGYQMRLCLGANQPCLGTCTSWAKKNERTTSLSVPIRTYLNVCVRPTGVYHGGGSIGGIWTKEGFNVYRVYAPEGQPYKIEAIQGGCLPPSN